MTTWRSCQPHRVPRAEGAVRGAIATIEWPDGPYGATTIEW